MTRENGEVAVQQNGQETAIAAPDLEGDIHVDLNGEYPQVRIPSQVEVGYRDEPNDEDEVATDGGATTRREIEMRGVGLQDETASACLWFGFALLIGSGATFATSQPIIGLAMTVGGGLLGYIGGRSRWGGA